MGRTIASLNNVAVPVAAKEFILNSARHLYVTVSGAAVYLSFTQYTGDNMIEGIQPEEYTLPQLLDMDLDEGEGAYYSITYRLAAASAPATITVVATT